MAVPALSTYGAATGQPIAGGRWPGGMMSGNVDLLAVLAAGIVGQQAGLTGGVALADVVAAGSMAPLHPAGALLDLLAAAPTNSWVRANASGDTFIAHQAANADKPYYPAGGGAQHSSKILLAWSSMAWDDTRAEITVWGGGHANTNENGTYVWRASTRQWGVGFYSADTIETIVGGTNTASVTIDGPLSTPNSAHTFGGIDYAPTLDRAIICPAANHTNSQSAYLSSDPTGAFSGFVRWLPMYTLDTRQQGQGKVAGATGSNVHRASSGGADMPGAGAWSVRDWGLDTAYASLVPSLGLHLLSALRVVQEGGVDVAYLSSTSGSGVPQSLFRIALNSLDYHGDVVTKVGAAMNGANAAGNSCVMVLTTGHTRNWALCAGSKTYPIQGWDLATAGASNAAFYVPSANLTGTGAAAIASSLDYIAGPFPQSGIANNWSAQNGHSMGWVWDPRRNTIVAVSLLGDVVEIDVPTSGSPSVATWNCTLLANTSASPRPPTNAEMITETTTLGTLTRTVTSVGGKLKWSNYLGGCYVYLTHCYDGQVWLFKPAGWTDPR